MDKTDFLKDLGFFIKIERMKQKISQEKLAELSDCSMSYIGFVERGEKSISLYNFLKIASVLNLDLSEFLSKYMSLNQRKK